MTSAAATSPHCAICGRTERKVELVQAEMIRDNILQAIQHEHPDFGVRDWICLEDLNRFRADYVESILRQERGELSELEQEVIRNLAARELLSENVNEEIDERLTMSQRLADRVATVGGSWNFVLGFFAFLGLWMVVNTVWILQKPFDPFPFILLNLVLSCLAAIQAPIIMMSQNRQEQKDRLRSEHDYQVNLKAEVEIRLMSERIDRLLGHHWQHLLELQDVQLQLMEELRSRPGGKRQ
jgi:uncharacterized membrane protein